MIFVKNRTCLWAVAVALIYGVGTGASLEREQYSVRNRVRADVNRPKVLGRLGKLLSRNVSRHRVSNAKRLTTPPEGLAAYAGDTLNSTYMDLVEYESTNKAKPNVRIPRSTFNPIKYLLPLGVGAYKSSKAKWGTRRTNRTRNRAVDEYISYDKHPMTAANKRFDAAKPKNVKDISNPKILGRTGKIGDRTITVRNKCTQRSPDGKKRLVDRPTVELFKTNTKGRDRVTTKIRHDYVKTQPCDFIPKSWNELPIQIRRSRSQSMFMKYLRIYYYKQPYVPFKGFYMDRRRFIFKINRP